MNIEASYLGNTVLPIVMDAYEGAALDGVYVYDKETLLEALGEYTLNPEVARYVTTMSDEEVKDFLNTFIRVSHRIAQDEFPPPDVASYVPPVPEITEYAHPDNPNLVKRYDSTSPTGWKWVETLPSGEIEEAEAQPPLTGMSPVDYAQAYLLPMGFAEGEIGFMIYDAETGEYRDYQEGDALKHGDYRVLRHDDPTYGTVPIIQQLTGVEGVEAWSSPLAISHTLEGQEEQLIVPPSPEDIGTIYEETVPLEAPGVLAPGAPGKRKLEPGLETAFPEDYPVFTGPEYPGAPSKAPAPEMAEALGVEEAPALTAPVEYAMTPGGLTYRRFTGPREPQEVPPEIADLDVGEPIPVGVPTIPGAPELPPAPLEWAVQQVFPPPEPPPEVGIETPTPVTDLEEAAPPDEAPGFAPPEEPAQPDVYVPEPVELPPSLQYEPPTIPGVREAPSPPPPPPPPSSRFYEPPTEAPAAPGGVLRMQPGAQDPYQEAEPFWIEAPPEVQQQYAQPPPVEVSPPPAAPPPVGQGPVRIQPGAEPGGAMWEEAEPTAPLPEIQPTEPAPYTEMPPPGVQFIEPPVSEQEVQGSLEEIMKKADTEQPALRPTKNVEFGTGTRVETTRGKIVKNRGGGNYSIPEGSSGEIIQDIFGDGTRFRIRIDDGGVADYNRGEISKSATVSELLEEVERLASHGADTGDVVFHLLRRRASNEAIQAVLDNAEQLGIL